MEPIIRKAKPEDKPFIEEIAKLTWEGEDYLARVFDSWVEDGNLYVLELEGKVIGTAKLTLLPDKVGWLEGLRVHPDYRGRGFGRIVHNFMIQKGRELAEKSIINALEFSTYFLNKESIAMAKKDGFKIVKRYYIMGKAVEEIKPSKPSDSTIASLEELEYEEYIPVGWKFVHKVPEALDWLKEKAIIKECGGTKFMMPKDSESAFVPFHLSKPYVKQLLPCMAQEALKANQKYLEIMVPEERKKLLEPLRELGFEVWDNCKEPNVLVFRKELKF
ncbi:GNAT family acetyltraansferase [Thermococcus litoralis DSM 5473]|uniref:GNAT family acetyltraansferase n=1 Tax=Thermococcus litoralis (strain ATCC 51850 / DSM 5473 / JCM 8560 / NS-C) TaxID=523849 RepID=H3ZL28_THELN|nr:GNAT family N-acetyltransferase [Thermococcus litoralis]EHR79367.1 GNAT family acetyltraansferase [Thermococcus litoralis DSM 5473]